MERESEPEGGRDDEAEAVYGRADHRGDRRPPPQHGLVLFLSGDGGWNMGVIDMAKILAAQGVLVAGLSVPAYLKAMEASPAPCIDLARNLARVG